MKISHKEGETMVSKKVIIKSLVCTALTCSFATCALAADKDTGENVQSNWMDRTDIGVAVQSAQKDNYRDYKTAVNPHHLGTPVVYHSEHSSNQKVKSQYFVETIQPIKHYDQDSKSVLFVQGRLEGNGGQKISRDSYWYGGNGARDYVQPSYYDKGETIEHDSLGVVGSVGVGYRRLSKHEHAYIGANAFYDYAFKDKFSRIGGGLEYVTGLNTISANIYHGLSEKKTEPYLFWNNVKIIPRADEFHDTMPGDPLADTDNGMLRYRYAYEHVLNGFNIRYTRDYKNARWVSTYIDAYQWKAKSPSEHPENMFYIDQHKWSSIHGLKMGAKLNVTPHLAVDLGFNKNNVTSVEPYVSVMYTLGKSRYAYFGGKHSEDVMTTARSKMLDKVKRNEMVVESYKEHNYREHPWDHI